MPWPLFSFRSVCLCLSKSLCVLALSLAPSFSRRMWHFSGRERERQTSSDVGTSLSSICGAADVAGEARRGQEQWKGVESCVCLCLVASLDLF